MATAKKSGLKLDESLSIVRELRRRIDGMIATLVKDKQTHQYVLDRREREIFKDPRWPSLPGWAHSDLNAYFHGKVDMVDRYHTVFAYRAVEDKKLYQVKTGWIRSGVMKLWDDLQAKHGKFDDTMWTENGSFWPCGKPYFVKPNGYFSKASVEARNAAFQDAA